MSVFSNIRRDRSLDILDGALEDLNNCERRLVKRFTSCERISHTYTEMKSDLSERDGVHTSLKRKSQSIILEAASRAHDIQFGPSRRRLLWMLRDIELEEIQIEVERQTVTLVPKGNVDELPVGGFSRNGTLTIFNPWEVSIGSSGPQIVNLVAQLDFHFNSSTDRLEVRTSAPIYVLTENFEPSRIFRKIPTKDGARRRARELLEKEFDRTLSKNSLKLPDVDIPDVGSMGSPFCSHLGRDLFMFSRTLAKRNSKHPYLNGIPFPSNEAIAIDKRHIEPILRDRVQEKEITVTGIRFEPGQIKVFVHKSDRRRASHVKIEVDVWLEYTAWIHQDRPAELFIDAYITDGNYKIKVKRCWPKCGKIVRMVEQRVLTEIDRYRHLTFPFVNLWSTHRSARAEVTDHAVHIYLERR